MTFTQVKASDSPTILLSQMMTALLMLITKLLWFWTG